MTLRKYFHEIDMPLFCVFLQYEFKVEFDSTKTSTELTNQELTSTGSTIRETFAAVPAELRRPQPRPAAFLKPEQQSVPRSILTLEELNRLKEQGELTEYGFERRKAALRGLPFNSAITAITRTRNREESTAVYTNTILMASTNKVHSRRSTRFYSRTKGTTKKATQHKYNDAYANSLRYVNRLYNDVFGIEARKVPAHVPHFVDKEVNKKDVRENEIFFNFYSLLNYYFIFEKTNLPPGTMKK